MNKTILAAALGAAVCSFQVGADTLVLKEGVDGYTGTLIMAIGSGGPDGSFFGDALSVDQDTGDYGNDGIGQVLLRFGGLFGPGGALHGATVHSASLRTATGSSTDGPVGIFRMLVDWNEASTWNTLGDGVGVLVETAVADAQFANIDNPGTLDWDVTASLQAWAAGAADHGWVFDNASGDGWDLFTDLASEALRPQLTVDYTPAPVPVPAAAWLLGSAACMLGGRRRSAHQGKC